VHVVRQQSGRGVSAIHNGEQSVSDKIVHVTDDTFEEEVLKSGEPVLVDYWADWCGPCKMIAPVLDEIADEYAGRLRIAKLNIDENPNTPPRYGIRGIPTLMLFKDGEVEATKVGAVSKSQLTAFIDSNV
jgi:thioredoxin 1